MYSNVMTTALMPGAPNTYANAVAITLVTATLVPPTVPLPLCTRLLSVSGTTSDMIGLS
jgi:hypothetical protein